MRALPFVRSILVLVLLLLRPGMSMANWSDGELTSGLVSARNSLQEAVRSGDKKKEHAALRALLSSELRYGAREEMLRTALRALDLSRKLGDPRSITEDLWSVAEAFARNGQYAKAVREGRNALALSTSLNDKAVHARLVHGVIDLLLESGDIDGADRLIREVEELPRFKDDAVLQARIDVDQARVLQARGRLGDALVMLSQAQRVLHTEEHRSELFELLTTRVNVLLSMGRPTDAALALADIRDLVRSSEDVLEQLQAARLDHAVAMAQGDEHRALNTLIRIKHVDDSLRAVEDATAIAVLQVLHDVEQREVDNAALREQIGSKERTILAQRTDNGILIALVAALAILLVLLGVSALAGLRMMRRVKLKNAVIRKQHAEIEAQHRELVIQNERLAESILGSEEKELLLKEIHHRMKNNLQVVESLLGIQMGRHGDPVLERQFREAQGRVRSMAMVHDMMYRQAAPGKGTMQDHFNRLGRSVLVSFGLHDRVSFQADVSPISLTEEQLLPLTLLVNELLTNAGKHAFEGLDHGHIHLQLRQHGQQIELLFHDNGIGRNGWTGTTATTFGSELIALLSEQLNGTIERTQQEGSHFKLVFGEAAPLRKAS